MDMRTLSLCGALLFAFGMHAQTTLTLQPDSITGSMSNQELRTLRVE